MITTLLRVCTAFLLVCSSSVAIAAPCYVIGDISQNNPSKPLGSRQNPYGSLTGVEADATCGVITVLYSGTALDGGIMLRDGQKLHGKKGSGGQLPIITNSTAANLGVGVVLAKDNQLKKLHIKDTASSAVVGADLFQPFGGDQQMNNILVSGANQSGAFLPTIQNFFPSIIMGSVIDTDITIKNSEIGAANVISIAIFQIAGHGDVRITNTTVRDQQEMSENFEVSPGIWVNAGGNASLDVAVLDTTVSNIGSSVQSNSDGLLLTSSSSGEMTVQVDGYHFSNPDAGGWFGTSTGIEMGIFGAASGGSFNGIVSNSVIEGAYFAGIQIIDDESTGNNTVSVEIVNNQISGDSLKGIQAFTDESPDGRMYLEIAGNTISITDPFDSGYAIGMEIGVCCAIVDAFEVLLERNTILDTDGTALQFFNFESTINSFIIDAGLGALGSIGENRIIGTLGDDILSYGVPVSAGNNWWGSASGPASVVELNGGTVEVDPFLTTDPN